MDNRDDIIRKINAIKAKAENAGSAEEAATFMVGYEKLMAKYNLTLSDLEVRNSKVSGFSFNTGKYTKGVLNPLDWIVIPLTELTDTQYTRVKSDFLFFGMQADIDYANWIYNLVNKSMARSWNAYRVSPAYRTENKNTAYGKIKTQFELGFIKIIVKKLQQMIADKTVNVPSTALVVVKKDLVVSAMNDLGLNPLGSGKQSSIVKRADNSSIAGMQEGDKVKLRHEVAESATLALTHKGV